MTATEKLKLTEWYQGSVKTVLDAESEHDTLFFRFSDDYSVFDWGTMPDKIADKGRALTAMGAFFFEKIGDPAFWQRLPKSKALERFDADWRNELFKYFDHYAREGFPTHYLGLVDEAGNPVSLTECGTKSGAVFMKVKRAYAHYPTPCVVLGQQVFDYPTNMEKMERAPRFIPLEVVFRFGMPSGSSLKQRLEKNPEYARQLGLSSPPKEGEMFDRVVIEFFTKHEPKDRWLSVQEALTMAKLAGGAFDKLGRMAQLLALALFDIFAQLGVELWDGKFEFIAGDYKRGIILADSIGPDELRLMYKGVQLSKETLRQVYRGTPWELNLKKAQKMADERGSLDWKSICLDELKSRPEPLPADVKQQIDHLYPTLANALIGQQVFAGQPTLDELAESLANGRTAK